MQVPYYIFIIAFLISNVVNENPTAMLHHTMVLHNANELNKLYLGEYVYGTKINTVLISQQEAMRGDADIIMKFHFSFIALENHMQ